MTFLPKDYQQPVSAGGNYMKLVKGENRIRIATSPIVGRVDRDKSSGKPRPVRTKEKQNPLGDSNPKHFRAMGVLHEGDLKVWEVTQVSIQDGILGLSRDEDWGDPKNYDLVITRDGDGMETKYSVHPKPAKDLTEEQLTVLASTPLNLEALYDGGNPFEAKEDLGTAF